VIEAASARGHDSAVFTLIASKQAIAAPIVHYLITNIKTGQVDKASLNNYGELLVSNLSPLTSYTFTVSAVNVDGTSPASTITPVIRTYGVPIAAPATPVVTTDDVPLAAPAFTLSASAETVPVNTAATGFTPSSTGGAIASYAISPSAPAGLTFNTATGILSGTPSSTQSATAYTITATNATGSATRTFTLTVTAIVYSVGDTGPGGGKIFYVATTPFACGPTLASSCTYLEAAPALWNAGEAEPPATWANAAALADSHTVTVSGVVYDDWYLPSKDELYQLYLQRATVGGFEAYVYWSSTEYIAGAARGQDFRNGIQVNASKNDPYFVRPVRAF
jgi:hypothetical protein